MPNRIFNILSNYTVSIFIIHIHSYNFEGAILRKFEELGSKEKSGAVYGTIFINCNRRVKIFVYRCLHEKI